MTRIPPKKGETYLRGHGERRVGGVVALAGRASHVLMATDDGVRRPIVPLR